MNLRGDLNTTTGEAGRSTGAAVAGGGVALETVDAHGADQSGVAVDVSAAVVVESREESVARTSDLYTTLQTDHRHDHARSYLANSLYTN